MTTAPKPPRPDWDLWAPFPPIERPPAPQRGIQVSARSHRIASIAFAVGLLFGAPFMMFVVNGEVDDGISLVATALGVVAFFVMIGAFGFLKLTRFGAWAGGEDHEMDERERGLRDRARQISFGIFTGTFVAVWIGHGFLDVLAGIEWSPSADQFRHLMLCGALLASALPSAVLAWLERDPPPAEDDDASPPKPTHPE